MPLFRKKPSVIEAVQIREDNDAEVREFLMNHGIKYASVSEFTYEITTIDGNTLRVGLDQWIIPDGSPGTAYPCDPEVFQNTYEGIEGPTGNATGSLTPIPPDAAWR